MKRRRYNAVRTLLTGVAVATAVTLAGMLLVAAAIIFIGMSDNLIRIVNQLLKVLSVVLGVRAGVGRGGFRGLVSGVAIGAVYAVAGYVIYALLGDNPFSVAELLGEMLISVAAGAAMGALCANMSQTHRVTASKA